MNSFRPTVREERYLALDRLTERFSSSAKDPSPQRESDTGGWKVPSVWMRIAFAVLAAIAFVMTAALTGSSIFTGLVAIVVAEALIVAKRVRAHGVEELLWTLGLCSIVLEISGIVNEAILLVIAAALTAASIRLLNPYLGGLGVALFFIWMAVEQGASTTIVFAGVFVAICSTMLQAFPWNRPFASDSLGAVAIVSYVAAAIASTFNPLVQFDPVATTRSVGPILLQVVALAGGVVLLAGGVRFRLRAPIVGFLLGAGIPAWTLATRVPLAPEIKLGVAGLLLFSIGLFLERTLRSGWYGITSKRIGRSDEASVLDLAAIATAGAHSSDTPTTPDEATGGGGEFGGGGATDTF